MDDKILKYFEGKEHKIFKLKIKSNPIKFEIHKFLKKYGYILSNYNKGVVYNKNLKRKEKLGKVLLKLNKIDKNASYLNKKFINDDRRILNNVSIIISINELDVVNMSTNRGWTSCQSLSGKYFQEGQRYHVSNHISEDTIIAYVVYDNDIEIEKPLSRCLFVKTDDIGYMDANYYGVKFSEFEDKIKEIKNEINTVLELKIDHKESPIAYNGHKVWIDDSGEQNPYADSLREMFSYEESNEIVFNDEIDYSEYFDAYKVLHNLLDRFSLNTSSSCGFDLYMFYEEIVPYLISGIYTEKIKTQDAVYHFFKSEIESDYDNEFDDFFAEEEINAKII
jgi:hypothetical protein